MTAAEHWVRWTPAVASADTNVATAVADFHGPDAPAGRAAEEWLKQSALADWPSTVTWLMLETGRVEGFYAIASAEVKLTQRQRRALRPRTHQISPVQPASVVRRIARRRDSRVPTENILLHAVATAQKVSELQGNVALLIDPFDEETASLWQERYGFRKAQTPYADAPPRLWLPLLSRS